MTVMAPKKETVAGEVSCRDRDWGHVPRGGKQTGPDRHAHQFAGQFHQKGTQGEGGQNHAVTGGRTGRKVLVHEGSEWKIGSIQQGQGRQKESRPQIGVCNLLQKAKVLVGLCRRVLPRFWIGRWQDDGRKDLAGRSGAVGRYQWT